MNREKLSYIKERQEMVELVRIMYDRKLTNAAGGNVAVKVDDNKMLITPSMMSEEHRCRLDIDDLLLVDFDMNVLEGYRKLSRETNMHILLLKNFKNVRASIHAHPQYCMVYAAKNMGIPSITEATAKKGDVGIIPYTPGQSIQLAEEVYKYFDSKRELVEKVSIGLVLPFHGVVCIGADLNKAYSTLERIETDAMCGLLGKLL